MRYLKQFMIRLALTLVLFVAPVFAGSGAPFQGQQVQGISDPRSLPSLEAWYDISDVSSMLNAAGAVPSTGEAIKLIGDKSGNSAVNVLALNGVAGNYASAPDTPALSVFGTGIDIRMQVALDNYLPSATSSLLSKWTSTVQRSYALDLNVTTGVLQLAWSEDGTAVKFERSTVATGITNYATKWIRATLLFDNGAAGYEVNFYTSDDGSTWTQLGTTVTTAGVTSIYDSTTQLVIGAGNNATGNFTAGRFYRVQIYNGIAGTLVFDDDFNLAGKLTTTHTEQSANAATVTINTSGATGARISGARDLVQMTAANQPVLTIAAGGNYLTYDGSNDYSKTAPFALVQPVSIYAALNQLTWTNNDSIYEGNDATNRIVMYQNGATPQLSLYAGTAAVSTTALAVATNGILTAVINGASSSNRVNRLAATTGNAGAASPNGFTLGARYDGATPSNISVSEVLIYSAAHSTSYQDSVIGYMARHWSISGGFALAPVIPIFEPDRAPDISPWKREDELIAA